MKRVGSRAAPGPQGSTRRRVNGYGESQPQRMAVHGRSRMRYPVCSQTLRGGSDTAGTFVAAGSGRYTDNSPRIRHGSTVRTRGPGHDVVRGDLVSAHTPTAAAA